MMAERAWGILAAAVVVYEVAATEDELLSSAVDRWLTRRPILTHAAVVITAAHLLNLIPQRVDPFYNVAIVSQRQLHRRRYR